MRASKLYAITYSVSVLLPVIIPSPSSFSTHRPIIGPLDTLRLASNVLPGRTKAPASRGQQAFLFLLPQILVHLLLIHLRHTKQHDHKHQHKDPQESELSPEIDHAEEREVDCDPVQERTRHTRCAYEIRKRIVGPLRTGPDCFMVVTAIWLRVRPARRSIAESLRTKSGVLRRYDHGQSVVQRQSHEHRILNRVTHRKRMPMEAMPTTELVKKSKHAGEDNQADDEEKKAEDQLQRTEDGAEGEVGAVEDIVPFPFPFACQALAADKSSLLADQLLQLTSIA
ncbi:hypothetical protein KC349_g127 [Hortaea werneckii]|nr:hypothetical protein KC349_g127 [Hortaea werneckii]